MAKTRHPFLPESVATITPLPTACLPWSRSGLRECDTLSFRMETAVTHPSLAGALSPTPTPDQGLGTTDCYLTVFRRRRWRSDLFLMFRADANTSPPAARIPRLDQHLQANSSNCRRQEIKTDLLEQAKRWRMGDEPLMLPIHWTAENAIRSDCGAQRLAGRPRFTTVSRNCVPAMRTSVPSTYWFRP